MNLVASEVEPIAVPKCSVPLQVREAIMTSALLRLPQKISYAEKRQRVDMILEELVRLLWNNWWGRFQAVATDVKLDGMRVDISKGYYTSED